MILKYDIEVADFFQQLTSIVNSIVELLCLMGLIRRKFFVEGGCCLIFLQALPLVTGPASAYGQQIWFDLLLIFALIFVNGFFSASEMAIVTLNDNKIRRQAQEGSRSASRLLKFIDNQGSFLATIQVGVTLAGFMTSAFAADKFSMMLYSVLDPNGRFPWLQSGSTVIITLIISYFSLVLGELIPKKIGMNYSEQFAKSFASLLSVVDFLLRPVTRFLDWSARFISRLIGINDNEEEKITEEEIRLLAEVSSESGVIHSDEAEMINKIFEFNDKEVSEIMTPRTSAVMLPVSATWEEALHVAANDRYSRIPVFDGDMDDIIGILHIKDLLRVPDTARSSFELREIVRPAYFVPESKSVNILFKEMKQQHISLAIVIDEYGGTDGIISMEDLLEEIVGEIEDEYDDRRASCVTCEDGSYILDARLTPEEAGRFVPELQDMEEDDNYDTIAGFVLSLLERIPEEDEQPAVQYENLRFTVLEMDDHRIAKIRLEILPRETD